MVLVYIQSQNEIIASVYRPPDTPHHFFVKVLDELQYLINNYSENDRVPDLHISGDFNLPLADWQQPNPLTCPDPSYVKVQEFMDSNFLTQTILVPTRRKNTLDLVFTNKPQDTVEVTSYKTLLSDHNMVESILNHNPMSPINKLPPNVDPWSFRAFDYYKADYDSIKVDLALCDWAGLKAVCDNDGDEDCSIFKELIIQTVLQITIKNSPPNARTRQSQQKDRHMNVLKRRRRKFNAKIAALRVVNPDSQNLPKLEEQVSLVAYDIKERIEEKLNFREKKAVDTIKDNQKYFYSYAKKFSKAKSTVGPLRSEEGNLISAAKEKAEILQKQYLTVFSNPEDADIDCSVSAIKPSHAATLTDIEFTEENIIEAISELDPYAATPDGDIPAKILCNCKESLAKPIWMMWKKSFGLGKIPPSLKMQYITPIFKKGNRTEAGNYRPVSVTSHLIKIFERVIRNSLVVFLEENNVLTSNQHGFRKKRSCLTQLLGHVDNILKSLNSGNEVDVIYLDYAKAFDKVDHNILLAKLSKYGIQGKLRDWIRCFLNHRLQTVVVEGEKSSFQDVKSGVPQGTVLGPIFFIVYITDLIFSLKSCKALSFADDTKLIQLILGVLSKAMLQDDLNSVIDWSQLNNMQLHQDKFEVMNYCLKSSYLLRQLPFTAEQLQYSTTDGHIMEPSATVRDLGIMMSNDCSWTAHIQKITKEANVIAAWVLSVFRDRSQYLMVTLLKSMIRPKLEYCCPLWNPNKIGDIQCIESIQRQFTRRISSCKNLNYWERLKRLQILSLQRRRERYSIIHVWKIYNGHAPNDINMDFYTTKRLGVRLRIPTYNHTAQKSVSTALEDSFSVKAARLWNILPKYVNEEKTLDSFKSYLGIFLDSFPDMPPTPGYTPPNSNSLLDWRCYGGDLGGHA